MIGLRPRSRTLMEKPSIILHPAKLGMATKAKCVMRESNAGFTVSHQKAWESFSRFRMTATASRSCQFVQDLSPWPNISRSKKPGEELEFRGALLKHGQLCHSIHMMLGTVTYSAD